MIKKLGMPEIGITLGSQLPKGLEKLELGRENLGSESKLKLLLRNQAASFRLRRTERGGKGSLENFSGKGSSKKEKGQIQARRSRQSRIPQPVVHV